MNKKTLTRLDLSEALIREIGLPRTETIELVDMVLSEISAAAIAGEDIKLSLFGSFLLNDKTARVGRNPKTGEEATIKSRRVISFRPSQNLKSHVNEGCLAKYKG